MYRSSGIFFLKRYVMTYKEQLRTKEWKIKRRHILIRDNFKCQLCGHSNINHLNVHHREYRDGLKAWEYDDTYLITLCNEHHRQVHNTLLIHRKIEKTKIDNIIKSMCENEKINI